MNPSQVLRIFTVFYRITQSTKGGTSSSTLILFYSNMTSQRLKDVIPVSTRRRLTRCNNVVWTSTTFVTTLKRRHVFTGDMQPSIFD